MPVTVAVCKVGLIEDEAAKYIFFLLKNVAEMRNILIGSTIRGFAPACDAKSFASLRIQSPSFFVQGNQLDFCCNGFIEKYQLMI